MRNPTAEEPTLGVVIPCFSKTGDLDVLVSKLRSIRNAHVKQIVLVNDRGNSDEVSERLSNIALTDPNVIVVELARNYGQAIATLVGLRYVSTDFVATVDDDGEHSPHDLDLALQAIRSRPDLDAILITIGRKHRGVIRRTMSSVYDQLIKMFAGASWSTSFRLMRSWLATELSHRQLEGRSIADNVALLTSRILVTPSQASTSRQMSSYSGRRLMRSAISNVLGLPRVTLAPFFAGTLLAFIALLMVLINALASLFLRGTIASGFLTTLGLFLLVLTVMLLGFATLLVLISRLIAIVGAQPLPKPRRAFSFDTEGKTIEWR